MRIRELRQELDFTQEELGKKIGQTKSNISKYETGSLEPGIDTLKTLSVIFNVSVDYLLGVSDIRNPYKDNTDTNKDNDEPITIAAHHDGEEYTDKELDDIEKFKRWVLDKRDM